MMLEEWMTRTGTTDEQLADGVGIDRSTASRIRRGKLLPSSSLIAKIAHFTGGDVEPNSFFVVCRQDGDAA